MKPDKKSWHNRAKEKKKEIDLELEGSGGVGKGDTFAMIVSAFLVFLPISAAVLGLLSLIMLLIFRAF